jgi:hypothetical protein
LTTIFIYIHRVRCREVKNDFILFLKRLKVKMHQGETRANKNFVLSRRKAAAADVDLIFAELAERNTSMITFYGYGFTKNFLKILLNTHIQ